MELSHGQIRAIFYFQFCCKKSATDPMAETPRHGDIVADIENVLQTVFVYINENSCCFH